MKCNSLDLNLRTHHGKTILNLASDKCHLEVVHESLVLREVDANARNVDGCTSLISHGAVVQVRVLQELLKEQRVIINLLLRSRQAASMSTRTIIGLTLSLPVQGLTRIS